MENVDAIISSGFRANLTNPQIIIEWLHLEQAILKQSVRLPKNSWQGLGKEISRKNTGRIAPVGTRLVYVRQGRGQHGGTAHTITINV